MNVFVLPVCTVYKRLPREGILNLTEHLYLFGFKNENESFFAVFALKNEFLVEPLYHLFTQINISFKSVGFCALKPKYRSMGFVAIS